jgi:hypothetical protein
VLRTVGDEWQPVPLPSADGGAELASSAFSLTRIKGTSSLIAAGFRTTTDPNPELADGANPSELFSIPVVGDIALWRSDDLGVTWATWNDEQFAGVAGGQIALDIVDTSFGPFLLEADLGDWAAWVDLDDPNAPRPDVTATLWSAGERDRQPRWVDTGVDLGSIGGPLAPQGIVEYLANPGDAPGRVIVTLGWFESESQSSPVRVSMVDPGSFTSGSIDLTDATGFEQPESAVALDGALLLFGRYPRPGSESDLQVMQLTVDGPDGRHIPYEKVPAA